MRIKKSDLIDLALQSLSANRLRSSLTILGITIGVFSVVGVMTALTAVRQSIDSGLSIFAANVFSISREPTIQISGNRQEWRRRPQVKPKQAYELADRMWAEGIATTVYESDWGEIVRFGDRSTAKNKTIVGTNQNYIITNKYEIAYGRNLSPTDIEFNRPVIVLGQEVVEELFFDMNPIGETVVADGDKYEVIGVLEEKGTLFGQTTDNVVIVPVTRFVENNWGHWRSMQISVMAPSAESMISVQDLATHVFRQIRGLGPEDKNDFEISSNESLQDSFAKIAFIVGTGGLMISAIALLCAGIGIMNIMLVSVTERTREIGLRKSIGARRKDILIQFLLEAIFLSLVGGIIGILLGWGVGNLVALQLNVPMIIPWLWIAAALSICTLIGISFGFFPALRAANLKPIDALRYE